MSNLNSNVASTPRKTETENGTHHTEVWSCRQHASHRRMENGIDFDMTRKMRKDGASMHHTGRKYIA